MHIKNFEFKARVENLKEYEKQLLLLNPIFVGTDHQIDTYFNTEIGRLKLRQGNIENSLIQYDRKNTANSKQSDVILYSHPNSNSLKEILVKQFGIKVIVDKTRKIYFIENIKFHFDEVLNLGTFIEVEAIDNSNEFSVEELKKSCDKYFEYFGLLDCQLVDKSYSDLLYQE